MQSLSNTNFGPVVAYLVPGATALWGFGRFSSTLQSWFASSPTDAPTIGGFLYLTVASLAAGMTVNAIRWVIVDTLHARTGLPLPPEDFSSLGQNVAAYNLLIEIHYHHFQFHANMLIATAVAYACYRIDLGLASSWGWPDLGVMVLEMLFYVTSRDTMRKYHSRGRQLLSNR